MPLQQTVSCTAKTPRKTHHIIDPYVGKNLYRIDKVPWLFWVLWEGFFVKSPWWVFFTNLEALVESQGVKNPDYCV
jgi:hypothetical protein